MKNITLGIICAVGLILSGCTGSAGVGIGPWKFSPVAQKVDYTGKNFNASVFRSADSTTETLHVVGIVNPNPGAKTMPKVVGTLKDTPNGGKQLDVYVNTPN